MWSSETTLKNGANPTSLTGNKFKIVNYEKL